MAGNIVYSFLKKHKISERTFVFICFCLYFIIGISYYINNMKLNFLDSIYFITVTIMGVGYGDITPETDDNRLFQAFYIIIGVAMIGTILSTIGDRLLEGQERFIYKIIAYF